MTASVSFEKHHKFQSAPPTGVRGDKTPDSKRQQPPVVSIRSPHRSEGRPGIEGATGFINAFQSTPPTGVRGDLVIIDECHDMRKFQSAPPTGVRGDD